MQLLLMVWNFKQNFVHIKIVYQYLLFPELKLHENLNSSLITVVSLLHITSMLVLLAFILFYYSAMLETMSTSVLGAGAYQGITIDLPSFRSLYLLFIII